MAKLRSMVYRKGRHGSLKGLRALVREDPDNPNNYLAQFDERGTTLDGKSLAFGWHSFPKWSFRYESQRLPIPEDKKKPSH